MTDHAPGQHPNSLANLKRQAAVRHGAYSAEKVKPERERVLAELLGAFPNVRRDRLELLAAQRARITILSAYVDAVGVIRNKRTGDCFPAVAALQREESAYRTELAKVEDLAREAATPDPQAALRAHLAQLPSNRTEGGANDG